MLSINYSVPIKMDGNLSLFVLENKPIEHSITIQNVAYPELNYLWIWKLAFSHVKNTFLHDSTIIQKFLSGNFKKA